NNPALGRRDFDEQSGENNGSHRREQSEPSYLGQREPFSNSDDRSKQMQDCHTKPLNKPGTLPKPGLRELPKRDRQILT
ncbi:MAG TPA: hypothetical protein VGK21_18260, partial [Candidatus Angelobacter sp.]